MLPTTLILSAVAMSADQAPRPPQAPPLEQRVADLERRVGALEGKKSPPAPATAEAPPPAPAAPAVTYSWGAYPAGSCYTDAAGRTVCPQASAPAYRFAPFNGRFRR